MILLATCEAELLNGIKPQVSDDIALLRAFQQRHIQAQVVAWDDPSIRWADADQVIIRTTWDYHERIFEYLPWAQYISTQSHLSNPFQAILWNHHKFYLRNLSRKGIPIIPTLWILQGSDIQIARIMATCGWEHVIVKPSIGAGGYNVLHVDAAHVTHGQAHLEHLLQKQDVLIQPFLPICPTGERSLIWIGGQWSTAAIEKPLKAMIRAENETPIEAVKARSDELQFAQRVLRATCESASLMPDDLLFARVDIVNDRGTLRLMELELIEPLLYFHTLPDLAERFVDAVLQRSKCKPTPVVASLIGTEHKQALSSNGYRQM